MNTHKSRALAMLILICTLLTAACQSESDSPSGEENPTSSPVTQTPTASGPTAPTEPATLPPTGPPQPKDEIPNEHTIIDERTWKIDTSYFSLNRLLIECIYVCDDDNVAFFVSPLNADSTVSESTLIYIFSLTAGRFREGYVNAGVIGQYPDITYDDGTFSIVTLDTESYEFHTLLFVNPTTLETTAIDAPDAPDLISVLISPDKRYAALSAFDALRVTDISFTTEIARAERRDGGLDGDDVAAVGVMWSPDSKTLSVKMIGWELVAHPVLLDTTSGQATELVALHSKIVAFCPGERLFYSDPFAFLPCGFYEAGQATDIAFADAAVTDDEVCVLALSRSASLIGLTTVGSERFSAGIYGTDGRKIGGVTLDATPDDYTYFSELYFTPNEKTAVFSTNSTIGHPKEVYVYDFGR